MDLFAKMLQMQLMLFCLILTGVLTRKIHIVDERGRKMLSDLLINVILPCNIVNSFMGGLQADREFLVNCLWMVGISAVIQLTTTFGSRPLFARFPKGRKSVLSYGMICSNSSFVGIPIVEALFGSLGVMYVSVFQIPLRFTMWTAGVALFTEVDRKDAFRKLIRHPCIVSVFLGLFLMAVPIPFPAFVSNTIATLSRCTIPVSMLVVGAILADAPLRALVSGSVLYYCLWRLVLFPVLVRVALLPFDLDPLLIAVAVLMSGMPAGSTASILSDKYGGDAVFASEITFTSTLLSIVTVPLLTLLF